MKKLIILCFGILFANGIMAQINGPVSNQYNNSPLTFNLGSFGHWPLLQLNSLPGTKESAFIFETGDGEYYTNSNFSHSYYVTPGTQKTITTILSLSGRYDTIKFPPSYAKEILIQGNNIPPSQIIRLSGNQLIKLTPIAMELNKDDEMLYILTYKVPAGSQKAQIVFFYNHTGFDVFNLIDNNSKIQIDNLVTNYPSTDIYRLRRYFAENWIGANNSSLAAIVNNTPNGNGLLKMPIGNYPNNLSWSWNSNDNRLFQEHNIFISIRTKENLPNNAFGYVEAALLYFKPSEDTALKDKNGKPIPLNSTSYNYREVTSVLTTVSAYPHDPNYIKAAPGCIKVDTAAKTKDVKYRIHFQNDGAGNAHKLSITVTMDKRLKDFIRKLKMDSFTISTKNRVVTLDSLLFPDDGTFKLVIDDANKDKLKGDVNLKGGNEAADWYINPETMGDIIFTLNIPVDKEADFASKASIVFYSDNNAEMSPVVTQYDTLCIRTTCNDMLFPRPIPIVDTNNHKIVPPPCTTCGCKKFGPLCWYWWLAIGFGIIIIIWAIARKTKNDKKNDPTVKY